jgi:carboxyl-terminal processing protease
VALLSGSYYAGYERGVLNPKINIIKGVNNIENGKEVGVDFSLFWDAWKTIKDKYVDSDKISNQSLVYGAISGLMNATTDPYTVFMPPVEADSFNQEISGEYGGIGAELGIKQGELIIVAPLKNTPAENVGLKAGDKIVKINDETAINLSVDNAVKKIRGEKGTEVRLTIFRDSFEKPQEFKIIRDTIQVPTLDWKIINKDGKDDSNGGILYAQLYNFYEKSPMLFYQMAAQAIMRNPKGIILDLRNNPGGYLEASTNIASWFLNRGDMIVSEKFQTGENQQFKSENTGVFKDTPIVVLINQGSASASEILAGALRDNRNVKLVGVKSFGKGSVQELEQLKDNSQIKITIAHWLTPNGHLIDKNGLEPDYKVEISDQDAKDGKDPQFSKALDVINSEISKAGNQVVNN